MRLKIFPCMSQLKSADTKRSVIISILVINWKVCLWLKYDRLVAGIHSMMKGTLFHCTPARVYKSIRPQLLSQMRLKMLASV